MDIVRLCIPFGFICDRVHVSWRDLRFGLVNELLDPQAPVELGLKQIAELAHPSATVVDLAGGDKNKPVLELVEKLADSEPQQPDEKIRDKWLYLVLAWIYEHQGECSDPLQRVEEVYADFGYPEQVAKFVRYMPMEGADLGSREANEQRLLERWKRYIDETALKYAPWLGATGR